jgi:hypothetical protein
MKARFIGDPSQPKGSEVIPETLNHLGLVFEKGKFTEIPDELAAKFVGNSHFETQGKEPEAEAEAKA